MHLSQSCLPRSYAIVNPGMVRGISALPVTAFAISSWLAYAAAASPPLARPTEGLTRGMSDAEFDAALAKSIDQIYRASTVKV